MAVGLALEEVAPAGAEGPGATPGIPAGTLAVLAGGEGAGRSRLARVLTGMEPGRGLVVAGDRRHDLAAGPPPPSFSVGAVLDPPVLQSSLVCGANIRLGQEAAPRGGGRRAEEVIAALGIDPRALDLHPQVVPPRSRQVVALAQMLAAGKQAVVWDLARADLWADVHVARRRFGEVTWPVLVQPAGAALRHGELAGLLDRGRVGCFGPRHEVRHRPLFTLALRAERDAAASPVPGRPPEPEPGPRGRAQWETSSR